MAHTPDQGDLVSLEAHARPPAVAEAAQVTRRAALQKAPLPWTLTEGGVLRRDSVRNAMADANAADDDLFCVHDAARPFVSAALISRAIGAVISTGAAIPITPLPPTKPAFERSKASPKSTVAGSGEADDKNPAGAIAQCKDGMYSHAKNREGACSRHGGVGRWM